MLRGMDTQDKLALEALLTDAPDPGKEIDPERAAMLESLLAADRDRAARSAALARDAEWRDD